MNSLRVDSFFSFSQFRNEKIHNHCFSELYLSKSLNSNKNITRPAKNLTVIGHNSKVLVKTV